MAQAASQSVPQQLVEVARDIKLSHTLFALPFALLATFLAAGWADRAPLWLEFALILGCMVTARTFAMAFNRWADATLDGANRRTENRAIPGGRVKPRTMVCVVIACAVLFEAAAGAFYFVYGNLWPALLGPGVLIILAGYSYTKRFTWACHIVLGFALAISPVAAAIAIEPGYIGEPAVWLLALMVLCWVAGFDILYAMQDAEVDRMLRLHSAPARLGIGGALWLSRLLHVVSAGALCAVALKSPQLGLAFFIAAGLTGALLVFEHTLVLGGQTKRLSMAFFTVNGVISLLLGAAGVVDILLDKPIG